MKGIIIALCICMPIMYILHDENTTIKTWRQYNANGELVITKATVSGRPHSPYRCSPHGVLYEVGLRTKTPVLKLREDGVTIGVSCK